MNATDNDIAMASSPLLIKMTEPDALSRDPRLLTLAEDAPFSVTIVSPWTRAAQLVSEARRKYQPVPQLSIADLSEPGVVVEVSAGRSFLTADAIEGVVLKRDGEIVRPLSANVEPETIRNRMGAELAVSRGSFKFAMESFSPSSPLTIVCIGKRGNVEFDLSEIELGRLR